MNLNLTGKVFIVTGAAKGIGRGIAHALAKEGAIPVIVGRKQQDNKIVEQEILSLGGNCLCVEAELSNPEESKIAVEVALAHYGRIDGVVNNAGQNDGVGLENGSYEGFIESDRKSVV